MNVAGLLKKSSLWKQELTGESNGYTALTDGALGADRGCVHSSDEEEEDDEEEEKQEGVQEEEDEEEPGRGGGGASENDDEDEDALNCSGSRPLLLDSEEEEEEQLSELPRRHLSQQQQPPSHPPPPSTPSHHQPAPVTHVHHNHSHPALLLPAAQGSGDVLPDVFSKAPFRIAQEAAASADVFANAPFPRPLSAVQHPPDVFLQAPFGKRSSQSPQTRPHPSPQTTRPQHHSPQTTRPQHSHLAAAHPVAPEQALLGQVASQPFRPQALAKYSRHFEGPVPQQQTVATLRVVSNMGRQAATVGSVPLHSWTSEVSGGGGGGSDPFVSAPFHLKAPQEKP